MKLCFSYNADKDVENFVNGLNSVNNPRPTKFHQLYIDEHGNKIDADTVKKFIADYIEKNGIDVENKVAEIEQDWLKIGKIFIERCEKIFGLKYPREIIDVYLTTNGRCTYNIKKGYFFVGIERKNPTATIMHELLHFYTWEAFYKKLKDKGLSDLQYNDIKESLTEILNIEFSDLMNGHIDSGYPQHAETRAKIRELWQKGKDLSQMIDTIISREHTKKSILITGMSGSGKSTLGKKLRDSGYAVHDIENIPNMFVTTDTTTGKVLKEWDTNNLEQIRKLRFSCDKKKLAELIEREQASIAFYVGTATNISEIVPLFDKVILLTTSPEVLRNRLSTRTTHDFARAPEMQDWILEIKLPFEEELLKRGAIAINADGNLEETMEKVLAETRV